MHERSISCLFIISVQLVKKDDLLELRDLGLDPSEVSTDLGVDDLAALHEDEGRHGLHLELHRRLLFRSALGAKLPHRVLVNVNLQEDDFRNLFGKLLNLGGDLLARAAPLGEKVDDNLMNKRDSVTWRQVCHQQREQQRPDQPLCCRVEPCQG